METSVDVERHLWRLSQTNFSILLIKFPVNEGQKISNLVICGKMIISCLSQRNYIVYIEKLQ